MNNITFIIHLRKDTAERAKNVDIVIGYYKNIVPSSKFIVVEDDKVQNFTYLKDDPAVQYIHFYNADQHNKCKGYNIGLEASTTEIVCFLDIDCIVSKQNIEKAIETLSQTDSICIAYNGTAIYFNYNTKNKIIDYTEFLYDFLNSFVDTDNLRTNFTNDYYHVANTNAVGGMLFSYKNTFNRIGGFNPNFKGWGYEDNEIILRAKKLHIPIYLINTSKPLLFHLPHINDEDKNKEDTHASYQLNQQEYLRISNYTQDELVKYIQSWK